MKSIIRQEERTCFLCRIFEEPEYHNYLECHHIFHGTANRKQSEKFGLKVNLCKRHHTGDINGNTEAVHFNKNYDEALKRIGQTYFEIEHKREEFIQIFGRSWL